MYDQLCDSSCSSLKMSLPIQPPPSPPEVDHASPKAATPANHSPTEAASPANHASDVDEDKTKDNLQAPPRDDVQDWTESLKNTLSH